MRFTEKHILDFQKLYQEEYGVTLSREEAVERGSKLVDLFQIIYKPITEEDYQLYARQIQTNEYRGTDGCSVSNH